jgi:ankyrin repeat protein
MKSILTTILLLFTITLFSQEISSDIKSALKNDDATALKKLIKTENINTCFEIGNSNYTLLSLSIKLDAKACFNLLLNKKIDTNKACAGKTPLIYTAKYGRLEMAKMLIKNKADVTISYKGRTAKDYARKYEKEAVYKYLNTL